MKSAARPTLSARTRRQRKEDRLTLDVALAGEIEQVGERLLLDNCLTLLVDQAGECERRLRLCPFRQHLGNPRGYHREVERSALSFRVLRAGHARRRLERRWRRDASEQLGCSLVVHERLVEPRRQRSRLCPVKLAYPPESPRQAEFPTCLVFCSAFPARELGLPPLARLDDLLEGSPHLLRIRPR